jgi:hypothetical protein
MACDDVDAKRACNFGMVGEGARGGDNDEFHGDVSGVRRRDGMARRAAK